MPTAGERITDPWRRRTVWEDLLQAAASVPNKEFLVTIDSDGEEARVTYADFAEEADSLAASMFQVGVRKGDKVAVLMTNLVEWPVIYLATLRLGAVLVPINTWFKESEVEFALEHSGARHLFLLDRFRRLDFTALLTSICPEWTRSKAGALYSDRLPDLRNVILLKRDGRDLPLSRVDGNSFDYADLLANGASSRKDDAYLACVGEVTPRDIAALMYTSGSSGGPKAAMLEQWGLITASLLLGERLAFDEEDKWFGAFPFFHVGGSVIGLMTALARRATLVFTEAHDADLEVRMLAHEKCAFLAAVPAVILDQLKVLDRDDLNLSVTTMMVNMLPEDTTHIRRRFGVQMFLKQYGLTEGYGRDCSTSPSDPPDLRVGTCGRALDGVELRVVDPVTGKEVSIGEVGEACLRGLVMRGYYRPPPATAPAIDGDGWLHTQDLVRVDEKGYVSYVGRLKAMLKVGGENVAAEEVEECIRAIPAVFDCCVVPIRDDRKGEVPLAYVSLRAGAALAAEDILASCTSRLARFKVPARVEFLESLPLLGNNKVDRTSLKALANA